MGKSVSSLDMCVLEDEASFWHLRGFLREVFLLNGRLEHSWHVARLDYWRWHIIATCRIAPSFAGYAAYWRAADGDIVALVTPVGNGEVRLHIDPRRRTAELETAMLVHAEEAYRVSDKDVVRLHLPVDESDTLRRHVAQQAGFREYPGVSHKWHRDLTNLPPAAVLPPGYRLRSMGLEDDYQARSWASWRAFHSDEPAEAYDGDWSWYSNIQSAPLYRRDLDVVAEAPDGSIASFATIYYDDGTRSAVCVLVGTAVEHWRRGLGRAVLLEGFRRLQQVGATRVFATGYDPPASALYGSVMTHHETARTWAKVAKQP
jgi:GNAT superfamily N-acetyltransferase